MRDFDVLVVGAGAAGLAAACALAESGRKVGLIEGRDRVGGRICTRHVTLPYGDETVPVELGAEFIHGMPRSLWQLVREAGLETYELDGEPMEFLRQRLFEPRGDSQAILRAMAAWYERHPRAVDLSFAEYLPIADLDAVSRAQAVSYVEGFNAADHQLISVASLVKQQRAQDAIEGDRIFRLKAGYEALPKRLAVRFEQSGGALILGHRVRRIEWSAGEVTIEATAHRESVELRAPRAVITLPLGVLQARSVQFDPEPTVIARDVPRLVAGAVCRVTLVFESAFWAERLGFMIAPEEMLATWWTPAPARMPTLTAWAAGPKVLRIERQLAADGRGTALLDSCLRTLNRIFELPVARLEKKLISWHHHDWSGDDFARGAYSYVPAGNLDAVDALARPVSETLFFAGEHTANDGHGGTVHGALDSGTRAARAIVAV